MSEKEYFRGIAENSSPAYPHTISTHKNRSHNTTHGFDISSKWIDMIDSADEVEENLNNIPEKQRLFQRNSNYETKYNYEKLSNGEIIDHINDTDEHFNNLEINSNLAKGSAQFEEEKEKLYKSNQHVKLHEEETIQFKLRQERKFKIIDQPTQSAEIIIQFSDSQEMDKVISRLVAMKLNSDINITVRNQNKNFRNRDDRNYKDSLPLKCLICNGSRITKVCRRLKESDDKADFLIKRGICIYCASHIYDRVNGCKIRDRLNCKVCGQNHVTACH